MAVDIEFICMNSFLFGSICVGAVDHTCWHMSSGLVVDVKDIQSEPGFPAWFARGGGLSSKIEVQKCLNAFIIILTKMCSLSEIRRFILFVLINCFKCAKFKLSVSKFWHKL